MFLCCRCCLWEMTSVLRWIWTAQCPQTVILGTVGFGFDAHRARQGQRTLAVLRLPTREEATAKTWTGFGESQLEVSEHSRL